MTDQPRRCPAVCDNRAGCPPPVVGTRARHPPPDGWAPTRLSTGGGFPPRKRQTWPSTRKYTLAHSLSLGGAPGRSAGLLHVCTRGRKKFGSSAAYNNPPPSESANLAANKSASKSAVRFTQLGVSGGACCVVIVPFCMALRNQCCTQKKKFLLRLTSSS